MTRGQDELKSNVADGAFAGYGLAALVGAGAALVYLAAVAALVHEPAHHAHLEDAGHSAAQRIRMVFATARFEIATSITVRVIFASDPETLRALAAAS